jgi:hypothetical protein
VHNCLLRRNSDCHTDDQTAVQNGGTCCRIRSRQFPKTAHAGQSRPGIRPSHKRAIRTGPVLSSSGIMPRWHVQHLIMLSFRRSPWVVGLSAQSTTTTPLAAPGTDKSSAACDQFGPPGSPPAVTGDLLNVAKDLLVRVVTRSLRHRGSDGQLPVDLAPQSAPRGRMLTGSVRILSLTWVELSGLEPLTSCMP